MLESTMMIVEVLTPEGIFLLATLLLVVSFGRLGSFQPVRFIAANGNLT